MNDDPLNGMPMFDRVSIRAILVNEGEDPSQALFKAGIYDPVVVPVVLGDAHPDMHFGDGFTLNLIGVLETEETEETDAAPSTETAPARQTDQNVPPAEPATTVLPPAYGLQPLAPVRRMGSGASRSVG